MLQNKNKIYVTELAKILDINKIEYVNEEGIMMREGNTGGGRTYGGTIGTNITFFFSRFPDAYVNEIYGSCFCILGRFGRCLL